MNIYPRINANSVNIYNKLMNIDIYLCTYAYKCI